MLAALLALVAAANSLSPAAQALVGTYATQQMEMGGGLELRADGRFRYMLSYGAVDETGEGDWIVADGAVLLTSNPIPRRPQFVLVRDDPAPAGELELKLEPTNVEWGGPLRALATVKPGVAPTTIAADSTGRVDLAGSPMPIAIEPLIPIFGPTGDAFPLIAGRGHKILIRFDANDLGQAAFKREPLKVDGDRLTMLRWDTAIEFVKQRPSGGAAPR
jgi:hypothetical protein